MSLVPKERRAAREFAVQFLYQTEAERLFHYSEGHFEGFVANLSVPTAVLPTLRELVKGILDNLTEIDPLIQAASANWKLARMPMVDRSTLRLAVYELKYTDTPAKVVINEAIELAKKFGAEESGSFVNAVMDRLHRQLRSAT